MSITPTIIEQQLGSPLFDQLITGWGSTSTTPTQDLIDEAEIWVEGVFKGMGNEAAYSLAANQPDVEKAIMYFTFSLLWKRNQNPDKQSDEFKLCLEYLSAVLGNKVYNYIDGEEPSKSGFTITTSLYHQGGIEDE